jgi:hypothetical protein
MEDFIAAVVAQSPDYRSNIDIFKMKGKFFNHKGHKEITQRSQRLYLVYFVPTLCTLCLMDFIFLTNNLDFNSKL